MFLSYSTGVGSVVGAADGEALGAAEGDAEGDADGKADAEAVGAALALANGFFLNTPVAFPGMTWIFAAKIPSSRGMPAAATRIPTVKSALVAVSVPFIETAVLLLK